VSTGFNVDRAADHETVVALLISGLRQNGYNPVELDVNGDDPDIQITDRDGRRAFIDVKTRYAGNGNWAVKHGSLAAYWRLTLAGTPVYVIWESGGRATVDTVFTLQNRIIDGPLRATGRGSRTDWVKVAPGGVPFDAFFPRKELVAA
jgi:hypothetical protein